MPAYDESEARRRAEQLCPRVVAAAVVMVAAVAAAVAVVVVAMAAATGVASVLMAAQTANEPP